MTASRPDRPGPRVAATSQRDLGLLGEPRVNVIELNAALAVLD